MSKEEYEIGIRESVSLEEISGSSDNVRGDFDPTTGVKRGLKTRHLAMMAIASIIGPGIFISLGVVLSEAGAAGLIAGFAIVGLLVLAMMSSVGELNTMYDFNFATHGARWVDPGFGLAVGYFYYILWACNIISEYVSLTSVVSYYSQDVPVWAYFLIFFGVFSVYQMLGVGFFGEGEYVLSFYKIFLLSGFYIFLIIYAAGGIKGHSPGNPFGDNPLPFGFKGIATSFVYAGVYYSGVEAISLTASEAKNPRKAIPIAVRQTIVRILFVYIAASIAYGITIPYDDPELSNENKTLRAPMAIAMKNAGWKNSGYFVATMVMVTCFSSVNSAVFIASRQLFSLAVNGQAPLIFKKVDKRGNPYVAIHVTHVLGALSMLSLGSTAKVLYSYIVNLAGIATFIVWTAISVTQYRFRKGWLKQGRSIEDLAYVAPYYPYNQYFAMVLGTLLILVQGWTVFKPFQAGLFVDAYILLPLFFIVWGLFSYFKGTRIIKYEEMDFETDMKHKEIIIEEPSTNVVKKLWNSI